MMMFGDWDGSLKYKQEIAVYNTKADCEFQKNILIEQKKDGVFYVCGQK